MKQNRSVLPGFGLTMGYTLLYLSLIVLIPLAAAFIKTSSLSLSGFWTVVTSPRLLASYRLTFGASLAAAVVNLFFGLLMAWVLVRYSFFGKRRWRASRSLRSTRRMAGSANSLCRSA
jgi:sulfate transport system permease protein